MAIDRSPNTWSMSIVISVAIHFAAVAWMGVSYAPENAREAEPMVMWLATDEVRTQNAEHRTQEKQTNEPVTANMINRVQKEHSEKIKTTVSSISKPVMVESFLGTELPYTKPEQAFMEEQIPSEESPKGVFTEKVKFTLVEDERTQPDTLVERVSSARPGLLTQNPELKTQNPTNAMLAFVGDPVAAGIISVSDGDGLLAAAILSLPEPTYPALSRKRGEEGRVVVKIKVSAMGEVRSVELHSSSSYPRLDRAALAAIERARFSPATEYGRPVESERTVAFRFELTK